MKLSTVVKELLSLAPLIKKRMDKEAPRKMVAVERRGS